MYELIGVRLVPSEDGTHHHIDLIGYTSAHMPDEPIMIPPARVRTRRLLGERFWVSVDGEKVDVEEGPCPVCGFTPQLTTARGPEILLSLPET